ncbi:hypothetical protein R3P38DRAFT_3236853 [Favolaschia claudopus]|uniref:DUF6532 domain-containing protein n=1 Tax=Favolaschia claudopus TaxID=2862362 RepID=A0AAV9ZBR6_9AGAR
MAATRRILSNSDDSDSPSPTSRPPTKKARRSADDVNQEDVLPTRTRTSATRNPSQKQTEINNKNQVSEVASLRRQLKKAEKALKKNGQCKAVAAADGPESEEQSDNEGAFQSSIKPLGPLPLRSPQRPAATIRRKAAPGTALPPKVTNRTFLTAPEQPHNDESSPPPSPRSLLHNNGREPDDKDDLFDDSQISKRKSTASSLPSSSPVCRFGYRGSARSSSPPSGPVEPVKGHHPDPKFADNYTAGGKPKASDYEANVAAIINRAAHEYELRILIKNYNPDVTQQTTWAKETYRAAGRIAGQRYKLTERIAKILTSRGSHARGMVISAARALFANNYGFKTGTKSSSAIKFNQKLVAQLIENSAFHYKDPDSPVLDFAENKIFSAMRKQSIFKNKRSIGIVYKSQFNPYPNELLALEFCALEHCTKEWKTGVYVQAAFDETTITEMYPKHLASIEQWNDLDPEVMKNIRTKFFKRTSNGLIVSSVAVDKTSQINADQEMALRAALAGRTGLTDSEDEGKDDEQEGPVNANGEEDGQ